MIYGILSNTFVICRVYLLIGGEFPMAGNIHTLRIFYYGAYNWSYVYQSNEGTFTCSCCTTFFAIKYNDFEKWKLTQNLHVVSENGKWSKGPSMVEKRGFFTLNNVGDTLGKKKQSPKV